MSSPKHRENNDLTTRHNKRKYNSMSSPKHRENNDLTTRHNCLGDDIELYLRLLCLVVKSLFSLCLGDDIELYLRLLYLVVKSLLI
jgi:DNA polymerase II large subunit